MKISRRKRLRLLGLVVELLEGDVLVVAEDAGEDAEDVADELARGRRRRAAGAPLAGAFLGIFTRARTWRTDFGLVVERGVEVELPLGAPGAGRSLASGLLLGRPE